MGLNHWQSGVKPPAHQLFPMGKQHKKIVKRSRRKQYLKRKNEQAKASVVRKESTPTKKVVKKTAAKKAATKKVAKKAPAKKAAAKKATKKTAAKKTAKKAAKKVAEEAPAKDEK